MTKPSRRKSASPKVSPKSSMPLTPKLVSLDENVEAEALTESLVEGGRSVSDIAKLTSHVVNMFSVQQFYNSTGGHVPESVKKEIREAMEELETALKEKFK